MATQTYSPIATQTLLGAAASITFSSIPGTYTDLKLVLTTTVSAVAPNITLQFNGDTTSNYTYIQMIGTGATTSSNNSGGTQLALYLDGGMTGPSTTIPSIYSIDLLAYAGSTKKAVIYNVSEDYNGSGGVSTGFGMWGSTAAITSVVIKVLAGNLSIGTIATLWGI